MHVWRQDYELCTRPWYHQSRAWYSGISPDPGISIGPGISPDPGPSSLIIYFLLILLDCDKISLIQAKDDVLAEKILLEDKENEEEINVTDKDD